MKGRLLILGCLFFYPLLKGGAGGEAYAQFSVQDSVFNLYIDFARSVKPDLKSENSKKFAEGLKVALAQDTKGEFSFDSLQKYKVMIQSSDKQVRIFTWDLEAEDGTHTFYGFVHSYVRKLKKFQSYQLNDKSEGMKDPEKPFSERHHSFQLFFEPRNRFNNLFFIYSPIS